jgi:8-oxo-dGTP pyrophosphatase MutT (NUDIX family)
MALSQSPLEQSAALIVQGGRVCLVTASSGRRWILPKGTREPGQSLAECAVMEAWEEAGIRGRATRRPIARYTASKSGRTCRVSVFRLFVDDVADDWPERGYRRRRWLSVAQAVEAIDVPEVRRLLEGLQSRRPGASRLR